jgi:hypothetical protein
MSANPVAVGTSNVAELDLSQDSLKAVTSPREDGDCDDLCRAVAVVEFKNPDVVHPTVDAGMRAQVFDQPRPGLHNDLASPLSRLVEVVVPVRHIVPPNAITATMHTPAAA